MHTRTKSGWSRGRRGPLAVAVAATAVAAATLVTTAGAATSSPGAAKKATPEVQITKDLAYAPAQPAGWMCQCGLRLAFVERRAACATCGAEYEVHFPDQIRMTRRPRGPFPFAE